MFIKRLASSVTETVKVLLRIAQYDLVESIKNTNTEACSDDLSSDRLSSFIFKAIKMHSSGVHFRGLITRFGAAPPNLQNTLSLSSPSFGLR